MDIMKKPLKLSSHFFLGIKNDELTCVELGKFLEKVDQVARRISSNLTRPECLRLAIIYPLFVGEVGVMTSTLSHFWQLASSSKEDRLASAHALVKGLAPEKKSQGSVIKGKKALFEDGLGKKEADIPENVSDAQLEEAESALESIGNPDLVYAIKRLIKGLASHRESARLGFSVALCELFSRTRSISTQHAIDLVLAYSKPTQKIKGQEERDMLFARLFGLHALVRSGVLCDSNITNVRSGVLCDSNITNEEDFQRIIRILHNISNGKHWLRESGTSVIVQAIEQLSKSSDPPKWQSNALKWLIEIVCKDDRVTADSVAIFMTLKQNCPNNFTSAQRLPRFANQELLSLANLPILARILRDAGVEDGNEEEAKPSLASGSTQAHFVWDMLFNQYADKTIVSGQNASFAVMYRTLVDDNLFAVTSSHQKKAWGFQLIQKAARIVDQSFVSDIFMPNSMRTLLNQLSAKDPVLQKAAQRACIGLQQTVKERPSIAYDVVLQLTGPNGNYRFDSVTNTKTVETILRSAPSDDIRKFADRLISLASQEQSSGRRASIFDSLLILVRNTQIETNDACVENILTFFCAHGLFTMKKALERAPPTRASLMIVPVSESFSSSVQSSCRSKFLSCLSDLYTASLSNQQDKANTDWILRGNDIIVALDKDSKHFTRLTKTQHAITGKVEKALKSLRIAVEKAEGDDKERFASYSTLLLASNLYAQAALQQEEEVNELIEPMLECANQLLINKDLHSNKSDDDSPGPMEMLIDCLSNALQQPTAFLRSIATQTFDAFADQMTQSSMRLLIEQLGFNQRNDNEDNAQEDEEDGEEEDDVMSDSVSDTSATSTSSEIDDEDVDAEFAKKIKEALQSGGIADKEEDEESEGDDDDDDDDDDESDSSSVSMEDFDDEQMIMMDDKLADIFRQKYATRKQEDEARKEEATFHVRIIDLLDHFALRQGDNALCVEMVLPLFTISFEKDKALEQLRQKAITVLRKTLLKGGGGSGNKLNVVGSSSMQSALDSLDAIHKMAATNLTSEQMSLANACNLYLTKSCSPSDQDVPDQLRSVYVATLNDFLERKNNNLKPSFLIDSFSRFPHLAFCLRNELLQAASGEQNSSQNAFRQIQVMEMLRVCIANLIGQFQQQQNMNQSITVQAIEELLQNLAKLTFRRVKNDQHRIKEILKSALPYVRLTRKLVEQVKQKTGKEAEAEIQQIWPMSEIQLAIEALNTTNIMPNSASLQGLLKQMMALITMDEKKDGKRKKVEDNTINNQAKDDFNSKGKKKAKKVD